MTITILQYTSVLARPTEVFISDSTTVAQVHLMLTPLRYSTTNFETYGDSTGIFIKIISNLTLSEFEKLLKAIDTWLEFNKLFKN